MNHIRPAVEADLCRITEIEIFNYRLNFYLIFRSDDFYFGDLTVLSRMTSLRRLLDEFWVYDDGVVKGFMRVHGQELCKLFVEPVLQSQGIGAALLTHAVHTLGIRHLWALEKNTRAIAFYQRHGFRLTNQRRLEEGTTEYLVRMER
ncbi:MAG: GNAT family N-acetyltransferase [Clostridia bacterium]|nr:GNAT family N-acetyltransferase [Clostridia bacterium]